MGSILPLQAPANNALRMDKEEKRHETDPPRAFVVGRRDYACTACTTRPAIGRHVLPLRLHEALFHVSNMLENTDSQLQMRFCKRLEHHLRGFLGLDPSPRMGQVRDQEQGAHVEVPTESG